MSFGFFFQMKYFIILICVFQWINYFETEGTLCFGKNFTTSQPVIRYCNEIGGTLLYRCCRGTDKKTFMAIDLMDADLTTVPDFDELENLDLHVIDLRNNDNLTISPDGAEFNALPNLQELLLPEQCDCPGGSKAWKNISTTTTPEGYDCRDPVNICEKVSDLCTAENSVCSPDGPTQYLCLCKTGYHGYKCLRYSAFPTYTFLGSSVGITIVITAILYWTQRRHVKK